mgnify:CR=1 FL=1
MLGADWAALRSGGLALSGEYSLVAARWGIVLALISVCAGLLALIWGVDVKRERVLGPGGRVLRVLYGKKEGRVLPGPLGWIPEPGPLVSIAAVLAYLTYRTEARWLALPTLILLWAALRILLPALMHAGADGFPFAYLPDGSGLSPAWVAALLLGAVALALCWTYWMHRASPFLAWQQRLIALGLAALALREPLTHARLPAPEAAAEPEAAPPEPPKYGERALPSDTRSDYLARLLAHPALLAWETDALAENFREPNYDAGLAAVGTVTADFRAAPSAPTST